MKKNDEQDDGQEVMASPGLDKLFEKINRNVISGVDESGLSAVMERTEVPSKLQNESNFVDPHQSPGLDNLFAKFDKEVISSEVEQKDEDGGKGLEFTDPRDKIAEMEQDLEQLEKYWEVQDKWQLISWGLRQKQALLFRKHFLVVTDQLKDRFRRILSRFLAKRAEKQFEDLKDMILNFDKGEQSPASGLTSQELLKLAKADEKKNQKTDIRKGKVNTDINNFNLDVVEEESQNEDLDESR